MAKDTGLLHLIPESKPATYIIRLEKETLHVTSEGIIKGDKVIFIQPKSEWHLNMGHVFDVTQDGDAEVGFCNKLGIKNVKWNYLYKIVKSENRLIGLPQGEALETISVDPGSYEHALYYIKLGGLWRRMAWKPGKWIRCEKERTVTFRHQEETYLRHMVLEYDDGRVMPWIPTQCDMLENDWQEVGI